MSLDAERTNKRQPLAQSTPITVSARDAYVFDRSAWAFDGDAQVATEIAVYPILHAGLARALTNIGRLIGQLVAPALALYSPIPRDLLKLDASDFHRHC